MDLTLYSHILIFSLYLPARINSLLIIRRSKYDLFHILFVIKTPLRGRKDPLKFASLPTCGFVAQLVERPTSIRQARVQAPSKPEFFSGFFFCNFFNCSLPARINLLLIIRRSKYDLFHILFVILWLFFFAKPNFYSICNSQLKVTFNNSTLF